MQRLMAMLRDRNRTIIARFMNNTELRIWRVVPLEYIASIEPKCISFNHRLIVGYTIVIIEDRSTHTTLSTECAIIDRIVWLAHIIVFFFSPPLASSARDHWSAMILRQNCEIHEASAHKWRWSAPVYWWDTDRWRSGATLQMMEDHHMDLSRGSAMWLNLIWCFVLDVVLNQDGLALEVSTKQWQ